MNTMFAASLFDNPWIVAVLLIVGALVNWLTKRRAEKQARQSEGEEASPAAEKPPGKFNLEETLRQLMGEEPPAPKPVPTPPPLPAAAQSQLPPILGWEEDEDGYLTARPDVPIGVRPPPLVTAPVIRASTAARELQAQADRRFEQLNEVGRHPATVVTHGHGQRSRAGKQTASRWRNPRNARQAFVASMIFSPPKSLEP